MEIEHLKTEIEFCEEIDCEKNENGVYIYKAVNDTINLPFILLDYKNWLIENKII